LFNEKGNTRGNNYKLHNHSFCYDLRKHFVSAGIVNIWNSLPNSGVDDKFWQHQAVRFDFRADLTGTGNRPEAIKL